MKKIIKMEKLTVKKIAILAILMSLGIVFKFFSIGNGEFRISIWDIPLFIAGMISGPIYGAIAALGADLIYGLCFSSFPFSFLMMLTTVIWGFSGGLLYNIKIKKNTCIMLFIIVLITSILATMINSIYLTMMFGFESMLVKLPMRILVLIVKWPITSSLVILIYKEVFYRIVSNQFKR